jgi:hypothetical protein
MPLPIALKLPTYRGQRLELEGLNGGVLCRVYSWFKLYSLDNKVGYNSRYSYLG